MSVDANQVTDGASSESNPLAALSSYIDQGRPGSTSNGEPIAHADDEIVDSHQDASQDLGEQDEGIDGDQADGEVDEETNEEGDDEVEAKPDVEEFEHDGEVFQVPSKLKPLLLRHSHYTKLSEQVEVREREINQLASHTQQKLQMVDQAEQYFGDVIGQMKSIDMSMNQINQMTNWNELRATDPLEFSLRARDMDAFIARRERLANDLAANKTQLAENIKKSEQAYKAQLTEEGNKFLSKKIKNWSPEMAQSLGKYAIGFGFSTAQVSELVNPLTVMLIRKAYLYDKNQQLGKKGAVTASPTIRPGASGSSMNSTSRNLRAARADLSKTGSERAAEALIRNMIN